MVYASFADTVKAKARQTSTMTSIVLATLCGDRETMRALSAYSMAHAVRRMNVYTRYTVLTRVHIQ